MQDWQQVLHSAGFPTKALVLDFETFWDKDYTLSKMSTIEYVTDKRFAFTGLACHSLQTDGTWFEEPMDGDNKRLLRPVGRTLRKLYGDDLENVTVVCQNANFDCLILCHHFGITPKYIVDTIDLDKMWDARARHHLADMAKRWKAPAQKGDTVQSKGLHWDDMTRTQRLLWAEYAKNDADIEAWLFKKMLPIVVSRPEIELPIANLTHQMFLKPTFRIDMELGQQILDGMEAERNNAVKRLNVRGLRVTAEKISGDKSFVALLKENLPEGQSVPMKQGKNKMIPALAKDDEGMHWLLHHENKTVRLLAKARQAIQSWPLHIKKVRNIMQQAKCQDGRIGTPLGYHGAHTGRWSGCECVTEDHEVLSENGWVSIQNWNETDRIAQWNDGRITFVRAIKNTHAYSGTLLHLCGASLSLKCTPEHRILRWSSKGNWGECLAVDRPSGYVPCNGRLQRDKPTFTEDQTRLIVATQADGWFQHTSAGTPYLQFRFKKDRKIKRFESLLKRLKIEYTTQCYYERGTNFNLGTKIPIWLSPKIKKQFPDGLNLIAFFDELPYWDGSHTKNNRFVWTTASKKLADQVQILAITSGLGLCVKLTEYIVGDRNKHYRLNFSERDKLSMSRCDNWSRETFSGNVYCPTVPSGAWIVRHNGCVSVTGNSINLQNLGGAGRGGQGTHKLIQQVRNMFLPPKGYVLGIQDYSKVEAVGVAWQAGQSDLLRGFATGVDVYSDLASQLFGKKVHKPTGEESDEEAKELVIMRGFGKDAILGAGYGMGAAKFYGRCYTNPELRPKFDDGTFDVLFVEKVIKTYRTKYSRIPAYWKKLENAWRFATKYPGEHRMLKECGLEFWNQSGATFIRLPSGRILRYPHAQVDRSNGNLRYHWGHLWGGALTENVVQAFCRDFIAESLLRLQEHGFWCVLTVHDEIVTFLQEHNAEDRLKEMGELMTIVPPWAKGFPLEAEGKLAERYCK